MIILCAGKERAAAKLKKARAKITGMMATAKSLRSKDGDSNTRKGKAAKLKDPSQTVSITNAGSRFGIRQLSFSWREPFDEIDR